jgi:hypothetical protein
VCVWDPFAPNTTRCLLSQDKKKDENVLKTMAYGVDQERDDKDMILKMLKGERKTGDLGDRLGTSVQGDASRDWPSVKSRILC